VRGPPFLANPHFERLTRSGVQGVFWRTNLEVTPSGQTPLCPKARCGEALTGGGDGLHGGQLEALFQELFQRAVEQLFVPLLGLFAGRAASARPSLASQMLHELF
jgi:hypothetical protein